jgi:hypothetical protein
MRARASRVIGVRFSVTAGAGDEESSEMRVAKKMRILEAGDRPNGGRYGS